MITAVALLLAAQSAALGPGEDRKCCRALHEAELRNLGCARVPHALDDPAVAVNRICSIVVPQSMLCCATNASFAMSRVKAAPMLQLQQTCRCRGPGAVAPEVEEDEVPIVPPPVARPEGGSRCTSTWNSVRCSYSTTTIYGRTAYHQVPTGKAPSSGWPAVFIWHGWDLYAANSWQNSYGQPYGTFNKALLVKGLLDAGFAVITPVAISPGGYWYTN
eukprot:4937809-Prymnesium_polylepis.1